MLSKPTRAARGANTGNSERLGRLATEPGAQRGCGTDAGTALGTTPPRAVLFLVLAGFVTSARESRASIGGNEGRPTRRGYLPVR